MQNTAALGTAYLLKIVEALVADQQAVVLHEPLGWVLERVRLNTFSESKKAMGLTSGASTTLSIVSS